MLAWLFSEYPRVLVLCLHWIIRIGNSLTASTKICQKWHLFLQPKCCVELQNEREPWYFTVTQKLHFLNLTASLPVFKVFLHSWLGHGKTLFKASVSQFGAYAGLSTISVSKTQLKCTSWYFSNHILLLVQAKRRMAKIHKKSTDPTENVCIWIPE